MALSLELLAFVGGRELALSAVFVAIAVAWYFVYARTHTDSRDVLGQFIREREETMPNSVVGAAETVAPNGGDEPTIMVALSNPRTERALMTLAGALAKAKGGRVLATHVVQVPDQTSLASAAERHTGLTAESERLLADARADAERFDVSVGTRTILSHQGVDEVFDAAETHAVDTVIMGYGGAHLAGGRAEGALEELTHELPCDVLVLNERSFDPSEILLPTAGGYSSDLSAEIARALRDTVDANVSLLYVTDDEDRPAGEQFLQQWATDHGLEDANRIVESGDVEDAIERAAASRTLVVVGATEEGLLSRIVGGSLSLSVLEHLDASVLLAERPHSRTLRERLFG
jgi:nucleotide-binding universal stress UspA family protein